MQCIILLHKEAVLSAFFIVYPDFEGAYRATQAQRTPDPKAVTTPNSPNRDLTGMIPCLTDAPSPGNSRILKQPDAAASW